MERPQGSRTHDKPQDYFVLVHEDDLGGCALNGDGATYYPKMWTWLKENLKIGSMIDVGCGAGFAADFFKDLGVRCLGVEGCKEAVEKGLLDPAKGEIILHDYKQGPYIPRGMFDLCWTCEFVEHVEERYAVNYLTTFSSARYLALTFAAPGQGGHHHVNERPAEYWVDVLGKIGFDLDATMTAKLRQVAFEDHQKYSPFYRSHFLDRGLFFRRKSL